MINQCGRHMKAFTLLLLVLQFGAPAYDPVLFSTLSGGDAVGHAGLVCTHAESSTSHHPPESPLSLAQCLEFDQPGLVASGLALHPSRPLLALVPSSRSILLPGFAPPIDIPPKHFG